MARNHDAADRQHRKQSEWHLDQAYPSHPHLRARYAYIRRERVTLQALIGDDAIDAIHRVRCFDVAAPGRGRTEHGFGDRTAPGLRINARLVLTTGKAALEIAVAAHDPDHGIRG